jgi:hypothetical protein
LDRSGCERRMPHPEAEGESSSGARQPRLPGFPGRASLGRPDRLRGIPTRHRAHTTRPSCPRPESPGERDPGRSQRGRNTDHPPGLAVPRTHSGMRAKRSEVWKAQAEEQTAPRASWQATEWFNLRRSCKGLSDSKPHPHVCKRLKLRDRCGRGSPGSCRRGYGICWIVSWSLRGRRERSMTDRGVPSTDVGHQGRDERGRAQGEGVFEAATSAGRG